MNVIGLDTKITPDISLVMIVAPYESASSIARALTSVKGVVNEAVLYWTGEPPEETLVKLGAIPGTGTFQSADGQPTPLDGIEVPVISEDAIWKFSSSFKVKAVKGYWDDDFSRARNEAMSHATGDWVLVLDADEALEKDDTAKLQHAIRSKRAIFSPRILSHLEGGEIEHLTARIFPRIPEIQYRHCIHEQPVDVTGQLDNIGVPAVRIHHYGYTKAAHAAHNKQDRNRRLLAKQILQDAHNPIWRLYLGQSMSAAGDMVNAIDQFRACMWLCRCYPEQTGILYDQAAVDLLSAMDPIDMHEQAILEAKLILRHHDVMHSAFWVVLGSHYNKTGRHQEAIAAYERAFAMAGQHTQQMDPACLTWKPHAGLAAAKWDLGRRGEALRHYEEAKRLGLPQDLQEKCEGVMREEVAA